MIDQDSCASCPQATYHPEPCRGCGVSLCEACWTEGCCPCEQARPLGQVPMDAVSRATRWLQELLAWRPRRVTALHEAAARAGYAWMTVRRAHAALGVKALKKNDQWIWTLPSDTSTPFEGDEHLDQPIPGTSDTL